MEIVKTIIVSGHIGFIEIHNPANKNILDDESLQQLSDAVESLSSQKIHVMIITGTTDSFSVGSDIRHLVEFFRIKSPSQAYNNLLDMVCEKIEHMSIPSIAMINGYCIGAGFDLASCCDIRVASCNAKFGITPAKLGLVYPYKGVYRIANILGESFAKELFFSGDIYGSDMMHEKGFVNHIVDETELYSFTINLAKRISDNSQVAIRGMKKIFNSIHALGIDDPSLAQLTEESLDSDDIKEGINAFFEKRKSNF